jgi:hypothetical protein
MDKFQWLAFFDFFLEDPDPQTLVCRHLENTYSVIEDVVLL